MPRPTPTCFQSTPCPRSGIHFPPRPIRTTPPRTRCSTTTVMLPAWIATMGIARKSSEVFPPPPLMRISQKDIAGISASDGTTVLAPAINQYESCLRCHGTSAGKQVQPIYGYFAVRAVSGGDPLNVITQFAITATSSTIPLLHASSTSPYPQPSLLPIMLDLDWWHRAWPRHGRPDPLHRLPQQRRQPRIRGARAGARAALMDQSGRTFWNAAMNSARPLFQGNRFPISFPNPDLSIAGPYGLCAKCQPIYRLCRAPRAGAGTPATSTPASPAPPATPPTAWEPPAEPSAVSGSSILT